LQGALFAVLLQPIGPQASSVHALPSSQLAAGPEVQLPLAPHVSPTVQVLPSLQAAPGFTVLLQPLLPQLSIVQGLPSSQPAATHAPPQHICPPVQLEVRLQVEPAHTAVMQPSLTQVAEVHVSNWQPLARSQRPPAPPTQRESSARWRQPTSSLQLSTVQSTPSSQFIGVPDRQAPASQRSAPLHVSPSSHSALAVQKSEPSRSASRPPSRGPRSRPASSILPGAWPQADRHRHRRSAGAREVGARTLRQTARALGRHDDLVELARHGELRVDDDDDLRQLGRAATQRQHAEQRTHSGHARSDS